MLSKSSKNIAIDEQPTQKIKLEQLPIEPNKVMQPEFKRQFISFKVAEQQDNELQSVLSGAKQPRRRSKTWLFWWVPLLIFGFFLMSILIGRSAIEAWISQDIIQNGSTTHIVPVPRTIPTSSPTQPSLIDTTAKHFMDAMMHKDWTAMWQMLSPDAQQLWQGEKDFIHFEQVKYGLLLFTSYQNSPAHMQYNWRDPDTIQVYSEVATLQVSLEVNAPHGLLSAPSNLALSNGLFKNTLFVLIQYQDTWRIVVAGPADLDAPILVPASSPETKLLVPIFMYHHVSNLPTRNYSDFNLTVTTTNFSAQLDWFQRQGYHSINQTELFDSLYYGKALPAHPMILTFDDGYKDMYTDALPVLLSHHYRGVFYIITGMIGGNYLTWKQVRTLAQDGMQIASHTVNHINLGEPPVWTSTQKELLQSKKTLETQLGQPIQFFCYPTGEPFHHDSIYEQQSVLADLFHDGYVGATLDPFSFDSAIQNARTPYQLPRIRASGGESLQLFMSVLNSTLNIDAYRMANGLGILVNH